jgi:hypothetical protein
MLQPNEQQVYQLAACKNQQLPISSQSTSKTANNK